MTLQFTSVLDTLMRNFYEAPDQKGAYPSESIVWLEIQKMAFNKSQASAKSITEKILQIQQSSVQLPIIRKAAKTSDIKDKRGRLLFSVEKGQTIICDIVRFLFLFSPPMKPNQHPYRIILVKEIHAIPRKSTNFATDQASPRNSSSIVPRTSQSRALRP